MNNDKSYIINKIDTVRNIIQDKAKEQDLLFKKLVKDLKIDNEDETDIIFDYCYNYYNSDLFDNLVERLSNDRS